MDYLFAASAVVNALWILARFTPTKRDDEIIGRAKKALDSIMLGR